MSGNVYRSDGFINATLAKWLTNSPFIERVGFG